MIRPLRVFLCHSSHDKPAVRELYQKLRAEAWIDPWLDEEKLYPGQDWDMEIEKAVEAADAVIVCLSKGSVTKEGYIQRELKFVLDIALEKPEGTIFVVPLRLEDCDLPRRLRSLQYVDYFPLSQRSRADQRLLQALKLRHGQIVASEDKVENVQSVYESVNPVERIQPAEAKIPAAVYTPSEPIKLLDLAGGIIPIVFFLLTGLDLLVSSSSRGALFVTGFAAVLSAVYLFLRRQLNAGLPAKITLMTFLLAHTVVSYINFTGLELTLIPEYVEGLAAFAMTILLVIGLRSPRRPAPYSSIMLGVFLLVVGVKIIINELDFFPPEIYTFVILSAVISTIVLWLDQ